MDLNYKEIKEKMCQVITRFYYSDSKEINLPPNEKLVSQVYVPWRKDYYVVTKEFKDYDEIKIEEHNFISKVRALTKEHGQLPFSQKYPILALEIENAAKEGKNYIWYALTEKMEEDLRAEGFTIESKPYRENSKISW